MTFCLGWKSETAAFLIADSAVTYTKKDAKNEDENFLEETSFGEKQGDISNGEKYVYEKALKLYSVDKIAITFAGSADFGNDIVNLIKDNLDFGRNIKEALENSISNYQDFCCHPHVQILVACYENNPIIYSIDNKISSSVNIVEDFISFGSPLKRLKEYSVSFYNSFKESRENEVNNELADENFLLKMLSLMQIYGIHRYTIENGIGGAYSGLYITKEKIYWQPDIYYLIHNENSAFEKGYFAALYIRNNCEFIITKNCNIVIENYTKAKLKKDISDINRLYEEVINLFDKGIFKYIVFLNLKRHVATILHMNYKHYHHYLSIDVEENKNGKMGLLIQRELEAVMNDNYRPTNKEPNYAVIQNIPYIPVSDEYVEKIKNILPEARISKCHGYLSSYKGMIYKNSSIYKKYYLDFEQVFAFIKHYANEEMIYIINCASDLIELEYKNGLIIFPYIQPDEMNAIFSLIPDKSTEKNMYLFDVLTNNDIGIASVQYTIRILTKNWDDAKKEAELQAKAEFGNLYMLTPIGIEFYHQAY